MWVEVLSDEALERIAGLNACTARELEDDVLAVPVISVEMAEYVLSATGEQPRKGDARAVSEDLVAINEVDQVHSFNLSNSWSRPCSSSCNSRRLNLLTSDATLIFALLVNLFCF